MGTGIAHRGDDRAQATLSSFEPSPVGKRRGSADPRNPNGKEIFYRNGDKMMVAELTTTPQIKLSTPRMLFEQRYAYGVGITMPNYDVTIDGQRFIMVKDEAGGGRLNVSRNWFTDLNRLAPASAR